MVEEVMFLDQSFEKSGRLEIGGIQISEFGFGASDVDAELTV